MNDPLFNDTLFFLRFSPMYKADPNWGIAKKFFYFIWKIIWILGMIGGCILIVLDILWNYEDGFDLAENALSIIMIAIYLSVTIRGLCLCFFDVPTMDNLADRLINEFRLKTSISLVYKDHKIIKRNADRLFRFWLFIVLTCAWYLILVALIKSERTLVYEVWLWYDWRTTLNYVVTMIIQSVTFTITINGHASIDMMNATFMFLTIAEINVLAADFLHVYENALVKHGCTKEEALNYTEYQNTEEKSMRNEKMRRTLENLTSSKTFQTDVLHNFRDCVQRHQRLLEFITDYQSFISPYILVEVGFNFSYMIFLLFVLIVTEKTALYFVLCQYITGTYMQIFLVNFLGDLLSSSIENLRLKFYDIPWYECDSKFQTNYKIVQLRMSKPFLVSAGKLMPLSLDNFLEFTKKAFSFFTVLRQMYQ